MEYKVNLQHNKIIHLEDFLVMYSIYNSKTLETLIDIVHKMHNTTTLNEKLFGTFSSWYTLYLTQDGINHYTINFLLYLRTLREKYIQMYKEFTGQLHMYTKAIRVLSKGYLSISLLPPSKLQTILGEVK